jgi:signal transduction histidine kinase
MYRIPGVLSAATTPAQAVPGVRPTRGPPPAPEDGDATGLAEIIAGQAEDRERIAVDLNDIVIRRLIAADLDLKGALGLLGDHPASVKIRHATEELDQAIRDTQDVISRARDTA